MQAQKRYANRYIACFVLFCILFSALTAFFIWCGAILLCGRGTSAEDAAAPSRPIIVIDAGHGGEDGGASGTDGTKEKDLNLLVAQSLADILTAAGYDVRMTRTDDRLLYDLYGDLTDYTGHKKTYDLRNRLRFTEEAGADLLISIHMNKFPQPQYSGLQVYYSPTAPESRTVAEVIRSYTKLYLQPENERETKAATSSIYLLHRIQRPAVMVECGFLSNEEELTRLKDEIYRRQLALVIACAAAESLSGTAGK
ncbi:MAG: N-acetylmuramoyl-L-alanine amidase [Clostridia bacterium]|nr:N-acetylmuramoyl-L-alanine amidase [Clostridia bacterium]